MTNPTEVSLTKSPKPIAIIVLVAGLVTQIAGCESKSEYPSRPITLVCPWSVGGGTDRVSRQLAVFLEEDLKVPVNVINATGGQGVTGHMRGLAARPDGYTLAMMTLELNMLHWRNLTDLTWEDCRPLMSVNEDAAALFVRADAPWQSLTELEADVRKSPGTLEASGTAKLGSWHLALAGWLISMDLDPEAILWIPHGGAAPSLQELMSGELEMVCCSLPEARSLFLQGEVRCLGVMSEQRVASETFADIPTFREQGYDWVLVGWRGIGIHPDTPDAICATLIDSLRRVVSGEITINGQSFPEFMEDQEFDHTWREAGEFGRFLQVNDAQFGEILGREEFQEVTSGSIGPMDYPYVLFAALGIALFALGIHRVRRGPTTDSGLVKDLTPDGIVNFLLVVGGVAAYLLLSDSLGFLITASVLLCLLFWRLGTKIGVSILLSIVIVPSVYVLFGNLLRVELPRGVLGF